VARFRSHEDLILDAAVENIFPLPADAEPSFVEGMLAGYAGALDAIGSPVTAELVSGGAR